MQSIIIDSVKIIASVVAGVAVGKLASKLIIQINAGTPKKYALNKKNKSALYEREVNSIDFSRNRVFKQ